jgi:hypothetical protein
LTFFAERKESIVRQDTRLYQMLLIVWWKPKIKAIDVSTFKIEYVYKPIGFVIFLRGGHNPKSIPENQEAENIKGIFNLRQRNVPEFGVWHIFSFI